MARLAIIWDTTIAFGKQYADYFDALIRHETREVDLKSEKERDEWLNRYKILRMIITTVQEGMSDGSIRQDIDPTITSLMFWIQVIGTVQLMRYKGPLIKNMLEIQPEEFQGNLRTHFFECITTHSKQSNKGEVK